MSKGIKGFQRGHPSFTTEKVRKKIGLANLGKRRSEEHKRKISKIAKQKGFGRWMRGRKLSEITKKKMSKARIGNKYSLGKHWKLSIQDRRKLSKARRGKKNHNWKGGIETENKRIRQGIEFRLWREAIFARDNWTCQKCKKRGGELHPHHIRGFAQYPELRFAIDNGTTLCQDCHKKFHKKYGYKDIYKPKR